MGLNNTILNIGADAMADAITHVAIHTAEPDGAGSNQSSAARQAVTWGAASGSGDVAATTPISFTGGASNGAATHVGLWSASTSGTFYGFKALSGDQTFNAAGEYTINTLTLDGSATA